MTQKRKQRLLEKRRTRDRAWLKIAKDRFISKKMDFFASIKDGGIIFNMDEKASEIKRAERSKNIGADSAPRIQRDC
jgi:hypothetical protein